MLAERRYRRRQAAATAAQAARISGALVLARSLAGGLGPKAGLVLPLVAAGLYLATRPRHDGGDEDV
ncbi:hypothetical protein [Polymorphum gilvum]|uniref:hypothetical protein n=1 Tax=Polymorphum gilvum TaxID=991904 RepID=UPI0002DC7B98|nr:hypothetical protein [Polymorphum gilvum]